MRTLGNIVNDYQRFTASANKIIELYYAHPAIIDRADAVEMGGRIKGKIEFRNVSFGYGKNEVLKDISFMFFLMAVQSRSLRNGGMQCAPLQEKFLINAMLI